MPHCRKCKKEIPEGSNYCNHCGVKQNISQLPRNRTRANGIGTAFKRGKTWPSANHPAVDLDKAAVKS